jgi:hypothetical protein
VHWALASWVDGRDDPPSLPGLTSATMHASLRGTWTTGSKDPAAEKAALAALDAAWQARMADPANAELGAALRDRDREAAALHDPRAFGRVLAALPAHRPEILERGDIAVFALTTVGPALPQVAKLIYERREQQALRGLARTWLPSLMARAADYARNPERRVEAELLALTMPSSPGIALLEQPPMVAPRRLDALSTWAANQHPTRTVHVLYGDLDLNGAAAMLSRAFASTALPNPPRTSQRPARPLTALRRSIVPRATPNSISVAWVLPSDADPWAADVAVRWLADARFGTLTRALSKKRPQLELRATGPWPSGATPGLLRIYARDPQGAGGLADELIAACAEITAKKTGGSYYRANAVAVADWLRATADTRTLAVRLARRALRTPEAIISADTPTRVPDEEVLRVLRETFAGEPAIVEAPQ